MESKFIHQVSKGSRFNQIYIPKSVEKEFEVGDIVEVRLLKKENKLYYSQNLKKLSEFKENLIKQIFTFLSKFREIKQIFIFGSFLTKKLDYNDIDILVIVNKEDNSLEKIINEEIIEEFNLKFHLIVSEEDRNIESLKISPILRSMFYYYVSNKKFLMPKEILINENHLKNLLMMPEDLLKVRFPLGKVYYDSLRKLITLEYFLKNDEIAPDKIDSELIGLINAEKLKILKENHNVESYLLKEIRSIIKEKLALIHKLIKYGKK